MSLRIVPGARAPASRPEMGYGGAAPEVETMSLRIVPGARAPASRPEMGYGGAAPEEAP